jgi:hypothetical protein
VFTIVWIPLEIEQKYTPEYLEHLASKITISATESEKKEKENGN